MKIGILGAGTMGSGIAQCFAEKGHLVLLCASSAASAQRRKEELAARLEKRIEKGKIERDTANALLANIQAAEKSDCADVD